jgi:HPt (histidine-containing phosphotransfer) domain-containing protein
MFIYLLIGGEMSYTDLSYINEIASGDKSVVKELIDLFILQVEEFKINFKKLYDAKDWDNLGKEAHKAKSSIFVFGLYDLSKALKELQLLAEKGEDTETYPKYIAMFNEHCNAAVKELETEIY